MGSWYSLSAFLWKCSWMMSFSCSGSPDTGCFLNFWTYGTMFVMSYTVPSAVQACKYTQNQIYIVHTGRFICTMAQCLWCHIQCRQLYKPASTININSALYLLGVSHALWHNVCDVIYSAVSCTSLHEQSTSNLHCTHWAFHIHYGTSR